MVCAHHFREDDFLNKTKKDRLKKNVVPTVFDSIPNGESNYTEEDQVSQCEPSDDRHHAERTESILHQATSKSSHETNEPNRSYQQLHKQYIKEKAQMNIQAEKLNHQIRRLQRDVDNKKKHIKFLNQKLLRQQKSKDALSNLLKELHAENLLDGKNLKSLEVSSSRLYMN